MLFVLINSSFNDFEKKSIFFIGSQNIDFDWINNNNNKKHYSQFRHTCSRDINYKTIWSEIHFKH